MSVTPLPKIIVFMVLLFSMCIDAYIIFIKLIIVHFTTVGSTSLVLLLNILYARGWAYLNNQYIVLVKPSWSFYYEGTS